MLYKLYLMYNADHQLNFRKKMKKFLIPIFITLAFTACGSKNTAFKHFNEGDAQTRGVQYTKKADIIKDNQIEVIFMSTYLNKIDKKIDATNNEVFLVSLYFANETSQDIEKNGFKILLNENEPVYLEKIEKDNENFKDLMLKNHWGNYYLVKFDLINYAQNLKLELTNQSTSKVTLGFEK